MQQHQAPPTTHHNTTMHTFQDGVSIFGGFLDYFILVFSPGFLIIKNFSAVVRCPANTWKTRFLGKTDG